jgi:hypothetical protein
MTNDSKKDISLNRSIKMWNNIPIDSRLVTPSLNKLDENINFPYIGMIFYSEFEDSYYKVLTLEDGYRVGRTGEVVRISQVIDPDPKLKITGYFIGSYEHCSLKENTNLNNYYTKSEVDSKINEIKELINSLLP